MKYTERDLTPWFWRKGEVPAYDGVYLVKAHEPGFGPMRDRLVFSRWRRGRWCCTSTSPESAALHTIPTSWSVTAWRGLTYSAYVANRWPFPAAKERRSDQLLRQAIHLLQQAIKLGGAA